MVVVDVVAAGDETADAEEGFGEGAKKMVRVAGPVLSSDRSTVIDTAGLWYFKRGRYWRHTLRAPKWPSFSLKAKERWRRFTSGGRIAAPGPSLMSSSLIRSAVGRTCDNGF